MLDVFGAEFIFQRNNTGAVPDRPISSDAQRKMDDYIPTGWTDNPHGVDANNKYEYISSVQALLVSGQTMALLVV